MALLGMVEEKYVNYYVCLVVNYFLKLLQVVTSYSPASEKPIAHVIEVREPLDYLWVFFLHLFVSS